MQVRKWKGSLAIQLPGAVIEALDLKEGDEVEIEVADHRTFRIARGHTREDALAQLRALSRPLPPGFRFSRDKANERTE